MSDSPLQLPDGEVAERHRPVLPYALQTEANDNLRRDSYNQHHQVAGQRVVTDIAGDVLRHAVVLVTNHFAVVGMEPDVQAGQLMGAAVLLQ